MLQKLWWWNIVGKQKNAHQSQPQRSNLPKSIVGFCWSSHEHQSVRPGSVLGHLVKSIRLLVVSIKKLQLLLLIPSSAYGSRYYKTTNFICHWEWAFLVQLKDTSWLELFHGSMQSTRVPWTLFIQVCIQTLHSPPLECVLLCQWPTHVKVHPMSDMTPPAINLLTDRPSARDERWTGKHQIYVEIDTQRRWSRWNRKFLHLYRTIFSNVRSWRDDLR